MSRDVLRPNRAHRQNSRNVTLYYNKELFTERYRHNHTRNLPHKPIVFIFVLLCYDFLSQVHTNAPASG